MKVNELLTNLDLFELPDGSKVKIDFSEIDNMKSLEVIRVDENDNFIETLCEVEYTEKRGLRTFVYNGDEEYPVHFEDYGYQPVDYSLTPCYNEELPF